MTRVAPALIVALSLVTPGTVSYARTDETSAALDARLRTFLLGVRCLVCQNETLAESRAELAVDLRREVREQMEAGRSDEEIRLFLTDRYGDFVLYRPPLKPMTYPLWFAPFVLLAGGFWGLYRQVTRRQPPRAPTPRERRRARRLLGTSTGEANR